MIEHAMTSKRIGAILWGAILLAILASPCQAIIKQGTIGFTLGSYSVDEPRFNAVYSQGGGIQGLTLSAMLAYDFNFYLEAKYLIKTGELTYTKEKTTFTIIPISFGIRYILPLGVLHPYAGVGGDYYIYYENNPIGTVLNHTNGLHALGGVLVQLGKLPLFLDLKLKYTRAKATEAGRDIQLGGFEYGVGFAIAF